MLVLQEHIHLEQVRHMLVHNRKEQVRHKLVLQHMCHSRRRSHRLGNCHRRIAWQAIRRHRHNPNRIRNLELERELHIRKMVQ